MNNDHKVLDVRDAHRLKITKVLYAGTDFVKDIRMKFPEEYNVDPISFMDVGLINCNPNNIQYIEDNNKYEKARMPKVILEFWGNLETIEEDDDYTPNEKQKTN